MGLRLRTPSTAGTGGHNPAFVGDPSRCTFPEHVGTGATSTGRSVRESPLLPFDLRSPVALAIHNRVIDSWLSHLLSGTPDGRSASEGGFGGLAYADTGA